MPPYARRLAIVCAIILVATGQAFEVPLQLQSAWLYGPAGVLFLLGLIR